MLSSKLFVGGFLLLSIFGCKNDMEESRPSPLTEEKTPTQEKGVYHLSSSEIRSLSATYTPQGARSTTNAPDIKRREAIAKVSQDLLTFLSKKVNSEQGEVAHCIITNDKITGKVWVEDITIYHPNEMNPLGLLFANSLMDRSDRSEADLIETKREKIRIDCEGGSNDGKQIIIDRPRGPGDIISIGKKVGDFMSDCLDGGGCVRVCKTSMMYFF